MRCPEAGRIAVRAWYADVLEKSSYFMPHGHCYLWIPAILWMHVISDFLIGAAYLGISFLLYLLVRRIRLPFSPVFIAFGLFIGLCGLTHFMSIWTVWNPDYLLDGLLKSATALASVATFANLFVIRSQVEETVHMARLSEQRRVELETAHAELKSLYKKVMQLDQAKTNFFANVSHELRTPLTLILGPAEELRAASNLNQAQHAQLDSIRHYSKSLLRLVNDMLGVAKLESGWLKLNYAELDTARWFQMITEPFKNLAESRNMTLTVAAPASLVAQFDPVLLERVVVNMLANAFRFAPATGKVDAELASEDGTLTISVTDNGAGIPEPERQLIFDRFRQVSEVTSQRDGGTGLGLAIVKEYTELHGGSVSVRSEVGRGSTFAVTIPTRAPAGTKVARDSGVPAPGDHDAAMLGEAYEPAIESPVVTPVHENAATVLVVEDNEALQSFIKRTLQQDYNVVSAADGETGLALALDTLPDLIVTDLMMPCMDGREMIACIRKHATLDNTPVLVLSARGDEDLRTTLLTLGAQDYLIKPFQPAELKARAGNLLAAKRAGDRLRSELASTSNDVEKLADDLANQHCQLVIAKDSADVAREAAERSSLAKSQFLSMISHELRTPLFTIQLNAQLLGRQPEIAASAPLKACLLRVMRGTEQMLTLIEGILEYTRLDSGRFALDCQPVDVTALIDEVIAANSGIEEPGVELRSIAEGSHRLVSDPRYVRVILNNLIGNALKFTRQGQVTVDVREQDDGMYIEVNDSGIGIPEADLQRIFEPFEQVEPIERKSVKGVGLGLALVHQLITLLGGEVSVASSVGVGSKFTVKFPLQPPVHQEVSR